MSSGFLASSFARKWWYRHAWLLYVLVLSLALRLSSGEITSTAVVASSNCDGHYACCSMQLTIREILSLNGMVSSFDSYSSHVELYTEVVGCPCLYTTPETQVPRNFLLFPSNTGCALCGNPQRHRHFPAESSPSQGYERNWCIRNNCHIRHQSNV